MEQVEGRRLPALGPPHIDHLDGGLYELRAKGQGGIGRALFVIRSQRVVIVHAFHKKTQKTPPVAAERAKGVT